MEALGREAIEELVNAMVRRLKGDWVLIGGALAALWLHPRRITEDIDLIGLEGTLEERLRLMEFAQDAKLPVEAVNSAADFFLRRIPGWREELILFRQGDRTRIYRPTATLFLLLKINRMSEQDLEDCMAVLDKPRSEAEPLDIQRVASALDALDQACDSVTSQRRAALRRALI